MRTSDPVLILASFRPSPRITTREFLALLIAADAQAAVLHRFADLDDRAVLRGAEVADDRVGVVHLDARACLQLRRVDVGIDIRVELIVAEGDVRGAVRVAGEVDRHAVSRAL